MHVTSAVGSRSDALHAFFVGLVLTIRTLLDQRLRLKRNLMNTISPRTPDERIAWLLNKHDVVSKQRSNLPI